MYVNLCSVAFLYIFSMHFFLNWKIGYMFPGQYSLFKNKIVGHKILSLK